MVDDDKEDEHQVNLIYEISHMCFMCVHVLLYLRYLE